MGVVVSIIELHVSKSKRPSVQIKLKGAILYSTVVGYRSNAIRWIFYTFLLLRTIHDNKNDPSISFLQAMANIFIHVQLCTVTSTSSFFLGSSTEQTECGQEPTDQHRYYSDWRLDNATFNLVAIDVIQTQKEESSW